MVLDDDDGDDDDDDDDHDGDGDNGDGNKYRLRLFRPQFCVLASLTSGMVSHVATVTLMQIMNNEETDKDEF